MIYQTSRAAYFSGLPRYARNCEETTNSYVIVGLDPTIYVERDCRIKCGNESHASACLPSFALQNSRFIDCFVASLLAVMSRTLRVLTKFCFAKLAVMIEKDGLPRFSFEETTDSSVIVERDSAIFTKHLT